MLGHVNNIAYFRYMEQARIEWLYRLADAVGFYDRGQGPVVVNASCNFLVPLVYPGDVVVQMFMGHAGRSSVMSYYELHCNGTNCADGAAKLVWIHLATGRSTPLPAAVTASWRVAEESR